MRSIFITKIRSSFFGAAEAIPLPIFLIYSRLIEPFPPENWLGPYLSSSLAALIITAYLLYKKQPLNRCFIGINLYFLIGCAGVLTHQDWLNRLLGDMQASAMLICIMLAGAYCSFFSALGFIGVSCTNKNQLRHYSLTLLAVAMAATLLSYHYIGNIWLSEIIPFITLFTVQSRLQSMLSRH